MSFFDSLNQIKFYATLKILFANLLERLQDQSSFMRIMLTITIVYNIGNILWITIPILYTNLQEPVQLVEDDWSNLHPNRWKIYDFQTDGGFPIGVQTWLELQSQINLRDYNIYTSPNDYGEYWGAYIVGDYFIYQSSYDSETLYNSETRLVGRIVPVERDILREIYRIVPDLPETLLPYIFQPYSRDNDFALIFRTVMLNFSIFVIVFGFYLYSKRQQNKFSAQVRQNQPTITIDPSKVRYRDDEK